MRKLLFLLVAVILAGAGCAQDPDRNPVSPVAAAAPPAAHCWPHYPATAKSSTINAVIVRGAILWDGGGQATLLWYCSGDMARQVAAVYISPAADWYCHTTLTAAASNTLPDMSFDAEFSGLQPDTDYVALFECDGIFSDPVTFRTL